MNTDLEWNKKGVTTVPPGSGDLTPRAHLCLGVGGKLERLQRESQALVRAGDELGSPEVSLTVQQTAVGDNEMTPLNPSSLEDSKTTTVSPVVIDDGVLEGRVRAKER